MSLLAVALAGTLCANVDPVLDQIFEYRDAGVPLQIVQDRINGTSFAPHEKFWMRSAADLIYMPAAVTDSSRRFMLKTHCDNPRSLDVPVEVEIVF